MNGWVDGVPTRFGGVESWPSQAKRLRQNPPRALLWSCHQTNQHNANNRRRITNKSKSRNHNKKTAQVIEEDTVLELIEAALMEANEAPSVQPSPSPPTEAAAAGVPPPRLTLAVLLRALSSPPVVAAWRAELKSRTAAQ